MRRSRIGFRPSLLGLAAVMALAGPAHAREGVEFSSTMEVAKNVTSPDGKETTSFGPTKIVVPGDHIRFTLQLVNKGDAAASGLKIVDPLPAEILFESTADTIGFTVSVDGGKTYGAIESLSVPEAEGKTRAATISDITHLQWVFADPLPPGQTLAVSFMGIIR